MGDIAMPAAAPQHLRALEHANRVRLARAELKRQIAAGTAGVAETVLELPWEVESMSISELLMSQRRWGRARCRARASWRPTNRTRSTARWRSSSDSAIS